MPRAGVRVIHRRTRTERRTERRGIQLREAGVSIRTRIAYFVALRLLLPFIENIQSESELDTAVAEWVELCWEDGESLYTVGNALSGLHFFEPITKRKIPTAWRLFATWRKLEWPARAPPITREIILSMAYYGICHHDIFFSCLLCLGFFTLLRTGELLNLRGSDLLVNSSQVVVSLKNTKTGQRNSADEMVTTDDLFTIMVVQTARDVLASHGALSHRLWEFSGQAFRSHFDAYLKRFKIQSLGFRPYSMRRGGATWLLQSTGSMELALLKGRWASHRVARIYIADGLSKLPDLVLPESTKFLLKAWDPRRLHDERGDRGKKFT